MRIKEDRSYRNKLWFLLGLATLSSIIIPFFYEIYWWYWIIFVVVYLTFKGIGAEIGSHRYYAHRSFKTSRFWQRVFTLLHLVNGDGTMIVFVGIHRLHHQYSDQPGDPHSPHLGLWKGIFYIHDISKWSPRLVIDVLRDRFLHHFHVFYFHYHALIILTLLAIHPILFWFYSLNVVMSWFINNLINVSCHWWGSKSYKTNDNSSNNWWADLILLGVGNHNNHHNDPSQFDTAEKPGQYDLWGWIIKRISTDGRKK